ADRAVLPRGLAFEEPALLRQQADSNLFVFGHSDEPPLSLPSMRKPPRTTTHRVRAHIAHGDKGASAIGPAHSAGEFQFGKWVGEHATGDEKPPDRHGWELIAQYFFHRYEVRVPSKMNRRVAAV